MPTSKDKKFTILGAGCAYASPGDPGPIRLGLQGRVVELDEAEAARLLDLGAVREAVEDDLTREVAAAALDNARRSASNPANPYGGTPLVDLAEHAQQVREQSAAQTPAA